MLLLVLFSVAFGVFVVNKLEFSFLFDSIFSSFLSTKELLLVLSSKLIVLFTNSLFSSIEILLVLSSCFMYESELNKDWLTFSPNCGVVCWSFIAFSSFFPDFFSLFSKILGDVKTVFLNNSELVFWLLVPSTLIKLELLLTRLPDLNKLSK